MREILKKYVQILKLELEDLEIDIQKLIENCEKTSKTSDLKINVFLENLQLFNNELLAVDIFEGMLDKVDISKFESLDELVQHIRKSFEAKVDALGLAKAINRMVDRKLQKVADYLSHD
jgi:hypothetical protein